MGNKLPIRWIGEIWEKLFLLVWILQEFRGYIHLRIPERAESKSYTVKEVLLEEPQLAMS